MKKVCFLFGNRYAPEHIAEKIESAALLCYMEQGARIFIAGQYGNFDRMAGTAVKRLKSRFSDITLLMLTPYHPWDRPMELSPGWDGTFYPEGMETVPPRFAIVRANEYMVKNCDCAVCYVHHVGNSRKLLEGIRKRQIPLYEIAE